MIVVLCIVAVVLTVAIIFGRRVAQIVVISGLGICVFGIQVVAIVFGAYFGSYTLAERARQAENRRVDALIAALPSGIADDDKRIMRTELHNYFQGRRDKDHVPDLAQIERWIKYVEKH